MSEAFARHASGLMVPAEYSREREVWTKDELKVIDRAAKLLASRKVVMLLGCDHPDCRKTPIERIRRIDGGITLRCNHRDREFTRF